MAEVKIEKRGARFYLVGLPFSAKDAAKSALGMTGKNFDPDAREWWVGAAKAGAAEAFAAALNDAAKISEPGAAVQQKPGDIRLTGKGEYKGKVYYAGAISRDGSRVRLLTLPDADGKFLDFWADCSEVKEVKRYHPRERKVGFRGETVTEYTTLGSIASFVADQRAKEAANVPQCAACGKRNSHLIHDLEDGLMKCRGCADLPAD